MQTECKVRPPTETERLFADLDNPSLLALSYVLRHPDTWPEGFVWNFNYCGQCAAGLAHLLWKTKVPDMEGRHDNASEMARTFAMPYGAAKNIFMGRGLWAPRVTKTSGALWWKKTTTESDFAAVTPEMIADQIDEYLATANRLDR